ncbi:MULTISPECIES: MFS transporter [unclassified Rhodococcus (in: high G+C Gram-positive bacteria)]|uniref:MFS transporter n=1 Tax=unclassified Rhodococcus (in: high G+C Gram-positive bacteria) TaxID=192944 RepID=UPI001FFA24BC|nr:MULTISPECIES: MFS transporter [unclassified Rhodococcus (in: high G+C Gram-positive bacteria)]
MNNETAVERWRMWPLYAAGFTTAFGAHAVAANLVFDLDNLADSLLYLGLLLALYDGAEVLLKPVFGTLADKVGAKPVLLGGLIGFAATSLLFVLVADTNWLWLARLGQGAAASAFSPAASSLVARLNPKAKRGKGFGTYGFYKSLGYTAGPLLGGVIVWIGDLTLLFAVTTVLAGVVAIWARAVVSAVPALPRQRQTVVDLARRLSDSHFLRPTIALAAATAALSVGVGFLPVSGAAAGLGSIETGAAVSVLALCAALTQPRAGRALDSGTISATAGMAAGLGLTALGLAAAMLPGLAGLLGAGIAIGIGTGIITPLAFASLAASTPEERMGQTMGAAELGRELGDAGGPLLVAGVAAAATLTAGFGALAALVLLIGVATARR